MRGQVVGITGSSGKTTARAWLQQLLGAQGHTHASVGSFNNHLGVPLSLARMPADARWGVFEVGMNNPGEIRPLAELVQMHVGLVLNVLPAHIGNFANLDGIRQEKLSLSHGLLPDGWLVVLDELDCTGAATDRLLRFGLTDRADVRGRASYHADRTEVQVDWQGRRYEYQLRVSGEHRVQTSLACFAVLAALGADLDAACADMSSLTLPSGRGNEYIINEVTLVDDSYNANPVSMGHGLDALAARSAPGLRVAVLGEMLELGDDARALHNALRDRVGSLDGFITVGDGFAGWAGAGDGHYWGHYDRAADIDLASLTARLVPGSVVLVKGSNKVFWSMDFVSRLKAELGSRA